MRTFGVFSNEGLPLGFYNEEIHGEVGSEGCLIPAGAIEISREQWLDFLEHQGARKWQGGEVVVYGPPPAEPVVPDRVSRRQFRLQLIDDGLLDTVEGWIATQDVRTQAAYADSGTFLRSDDMLQQGFAGLGFTGEQVDGFFMAAAQL